jgi:hypothetical protein
MGACRNALSRAHEELQLVRKRRYQAGGSGSLAQIHGLLTRNGHGLSDFHPSNWVTYSIDGPNKKVILGGQTFTPPPTSASTGFRVLPLIRNNLSPLAGPQGAVYDATNPAALAATNPNEKVRAEVKGNGTDRRVVTSSFTENGHVVLSASGNLPHNRLTIMDFC